MIWKLMATFLLWLFLIPGARVVEAQPGSQPVIIGDLSGSMRGFAQASGISLGDLYQILVINIPPAQLQGLKTSIVQVAQNQASFFAATRNYGGDTDLANAIKGVRENYQEAILVTDGLQSQARYLAIKEQLSKIAGEGWGLWLLEVDLPFHGIYDTEMPVDLTTLQPGILACARQRDPQAQVTVQKKNSTRIYDYQGVRPLLMFVFSKDAAGGRQLTQRILANISADKRFSPQVVEIAPLIYRGVEFGEPQLGDPADYLRVDDFATGNATIRSDTADAKRTKDLVLPITWSSEPASLPQVFNEVPSYDYQQCSWLYEDMSNEPLSPDQNPVQVTGNVRLKLISEVSWLRSHFCWLPGVSCSEEKSDPLSIYTSSEFVPVDGGWWDRLSTDTSWECPDKVFKLSELVKDVATEAVKRHREHRKDRSLTLKLRVGPL